MLSNPDILFSIILNSLLRMLTHVLHEPFSFGLLCMVRGLLVPKNKYFFLLKTPLSDVEA